MRYSEKNGEKQSILGEGLYNYLESAVVFNQIINVNTKKGNAVVISEEDYNGLIETLYLTSVPGMKERLIEGMNAEIDDCAVFQW